MRVIISPCAGFAGRSIFLPLPALPDTWEFAGKQRRPQDLLPDALSECKPQRWLSDVPSPGFHVVCLLSADEGVPQAAGRIAVYKDGVAATAPSHTFLLPSVVQSLVTSPVSPKLHIVPLPPCPPVSLPPCLPASPLCLSPFLSHPSRSRRLVLILHYFYSSLCF